MSEQKYCKFCGKPFLGRTNRKFDTNSCRVKYSRLPATVKKMKQDALVAISRMRRLAREFPHMADAVKQALQEIGDDVDLRKI